MAKKNLLWWNMALIKEVVEKHDNEQSVTEEHHLDLVKHDVEEVGKDNLSAEEPSIEKLSMEKSSLEKPCVEPGMEKSNLEEPSVEESDIEVSESNMEQVAMGDTDVKRETDMEDVSTGEDALTSAAIEMNSFEIGESTGPSSLEGMGQGICVLMHAAYHGV